MRPKSRLRFLAWLCVVAVLLAAAAPGAAGLSAAILAPAAPTFGEPSACRLLRTAEGTRPPDLVVLRDIAVRAPPLA